MAVIILCPDATVLWHQRFNKRHNGRDILVRIECGFGQLLVPVQVEHLPWTWPGMRASRVVAAAPWQSLRLSKGTEHMSGPHRPLGTSRATFIDRHPPPVKEKGAGQHSTILVREVSL